MNAQLYVEDDYHWVCPGCQAQNEIWSKDCDSRQICDYCNISSYVPQSNEAKRLIDNDY